jgi:pimeloyl-ACP methyl ester carboxylesterase
MKLHDSAFVDVAGNSIHVLFSDTTYDKWLVLWTGICMTAEQFVPILSSAERPFNVVAIDPPGHGLSDPWSGDFTPHSVQLIWEAVAHHFNVQHAFIGGHSYGAMSALMTDTILLPWVDGVVLLDGGYNMPAEASDEEILKGLHDYVLGYKFESWSMFLDEEKKHVQQWDDVTELIARATMTESDGVISLKVDLESAAKAYLLCSHYTPTHVLPSQKPALLLRATLPTELNEQRKTDSSALAERLTNMTVREVPNSGHDLLSDNRTFAVDSIWEFVKSTVAVK